MKTFTIYPDKARALGNVMNNNSNVEDMVGVNANVIPLLQNNVLTDDSGNEYKPQQTVEYDNLPFPIFEMGVLESLYATSLTLNLSRSNCYVNDTITVTATLRDNNDVLLDGAIAFRCGNDYITNGNNTGQNAVYANTTNGVVSFNYSFGSMGEYTIQACSQGTNMHHSANASGNITVSRKPISISINGVYTDNGNNGSDVIDDSGDFWGSDGFIGDSSIYSDEIQFKVQLYHNNQPISGLSYSITLDGETFDTGTSTANGEIYTITNLDPGQHTLEVYFPGNATYESCSESIEVYNGLPLEVSVYYEDQDYNPGTNTLIGYFEVAVYSETNPVVGLPLTITIDNNLTINDTTNSSGIVSYENFPLSMGNHSVVVVTGSTNEFPSTTTTHTLSLS